MSINAIYFTMSCVALAIMFIIMWKIAYVKLEIVFAISASIIGIMFILTAPRYVGIVWDDEVHYMHVLSVYSIIDNTKYEADGKMLYEYKDVINELNMRGEG